MYGNFRSNKGYTFVELIVVIATMAILFSVGFANYRSYQRRQYLETAVRMVKADLRLAQEYALSGRKPEEPAGNPCETSQLNGYNFNFLPPSQYVIEASCGVTGIVAVKGPVTLPSGISVSWTGSDPITFQVLGKGVNTSSDITITLSYPSGGVASRQIIVTRGGEIR